MRNGTNRGVHRSVLPQRHIRVKTAPIGLGPRPLGALGASSGARSWLPSGGRGVAAWEFTEDRSGFSLAAAVRVENALPNGLLGTVASPERGQQCEAPALPVHGVLPGRK